MTSLDFPEYCTGGMDSSSVNLSHSMADEPPQLLSLFDGDSGFLGADLDGTGDSDLMGPSGIGGALSGGDPLMSMGSSSLTGMSAAGMMNQQQQPSHMQGGFGDGGYGSTSMGQTGPAGYQMAQHQQGMMGQQYPGGGAAATYASYPGGPMAKLRSDPMMGQGPTLAPRGIQHQQQQHPSPYRSAQPQAPGSMMQGPSTGYGGYGMSQSSMGPRMPNPQQQHMGVGGWMGNQGASSQYGQQGHMAQQQQAAAPQQRMGGYGMGAQQGDYSMSMMGQTGQRVGAHYQNASAAQAQPGYCGPQGNGGHMMPGMSMNMMGMPQQQQQQQQPHPQHPGMKPGQMYGGPAQGPRAMAPMMTGYGNAQQQQQPPPQQMPSHSVAGSMASHYPGDFMNQRAPMSSAGVATQSKPQRYPYPSGGQPQGPMGMPQQSGAMMGQQGMADASMMSHYPNHSPYRSPPYPAMAPQRNTTPSPRPTGTPPLLNSTHNPAVSQGNYGQSSLQQLEQLVTPSVGTMSAANPFQQVMQSQSSSPPTGSGARMPTFTSTSFQSGTETTMSSGMASGSGYPGMGMMSTSGYPAGSMANGSMGNGSNANGPLSPSRGGMIGAVGHIPLDQEIASLSQKIQQLYNMPPSQQTQNQMVELQEKMRTLKAKKQLILMRQQQHQQQQQMQQQHPGSQSPASQQYGGPHTPTAGQMRPHPAPGMSHPHQGQQAQMQSPQHQQPGMGIPQSPQCSMMQLQMQQFSPSSQPRPIATPPTPSSQPLTPLGGHPAQGKMPGMPQGQMPQHGQMPGTPHMGMVGSGSYSQGVGSLSQPHTPISAQTTPPSLASQMQSPQQALSSSSPFSQMSPASKPLTPGQVSSPQLLSSMFQSTPSGSSVDPELPQLTATSDSLPAEPDVLFDDNSQESYKFNMFEDVESSPVTQNSDQAMSQQSAPDEANRHQEKAIRIAQEAVLKAQAAGNSDIPRVVSPSLLTSFDTEVKTTEPEEEGDKKPKRKRVRKPKAEKAPKPPKEPKENKPRPKRIRVRKKKGEKAEEEKKEEEEVVVPKAEKPEKAEKVKTPKKPRLKPPSKKKKLPPATLLRKKKRKRGATSDVSDLDLTPPGSPRAVADDDSVQKRRSARNTKRRKYNDDLDLNLSEDENQDVDVEGGGPAAMRMQQENVPEEENFTVEKILGCRIRQRGKEEEGEEDEEPEEEYYVKYRNYSYLHCEWRTAAELALRDKRIQMKLNRFKTRQLQQNLLFINKLAMEDYFNPDYVEVDRVLDRSVVSDPTTGEEVTHYLVKWRSLPYDESTWELASDVDPSKVELFLKLRELPPTEKRVHPARPRPSQWKQIKESRKYKNSNELREYQLEGVSWLTFCWYNSQNCILADEMGLGKTIQSITFLDEIFLYGIEGPFLVVAPLSTIANWQREFETWTDMNVITYHGSAASRNLLQEYEMYYKDEEGKRIPRLWKFHALITTYETIMIDIEVMNQIDFRCAIIDEAHRLKNKNCRLMEHLRVLDIEHVVLLTGTPLQNNTEELFSLLNYLNPQKFPAADAFLKEYGDLKTEAQVESLKEILKPMMLRRLKEDVEKNLAPKEETIIEVELTNIQKKYYRAILERNVTFLARGGGGNNMPNLMNIMMELRKCCNHPYLIKGAEEKIMEDMGAKGCPSQAFQALVQSCGKMVLLDKLLPKLEQNGHRVLVFSQMIKVLDLLEDYLHHRKYKYERLDGSKRGTARQEAIDRFSKPDSDRFVFLLCTRAGGLGINLTAADTVIIYDSDWNPQNDLQAQARCHRIGQNKPVKVYRLITRNSYEREMFDRASRKLGLDKAVLQSMGPEKQVNPNNMTKLEVEELLKKGAYGTLMDDDTAGDAFCEEDIDHILKRRTHVIQIESEGKGSTFAKASFSLSTNRTDIDINDPNFWQKWAKKNDVDLESQMNRNDLIIEEPRQRRQTARYGNEDCVVDMSDLESSTDTENEEDKDKLSRRGRKRGRRGRRVDGDFDGIDPEFSSAGYTRSDCFKVEKNLLIYGWGRWGDIISHGRFKRPMEAKDVHTIARAVLTYSLEYYQGDEKIKNFIWDLVRQTNENQLKNHSGLSAPVPRGRKGKKAKKDAKKFSVAAELEKGNLDIDPERILDEGYKRHLRRHSNKVLLRVRLLYYIKQEVIGDDAVKVLRGESYQDINIPPPIAEGEPPTMWWDMDADKSLLIGIYKHGYEKYNMMRKDPALVFLQRCGPPDGAALLAEQNDDDDEKDDDDDLTTTKDFDEDDESMSSVPEGVKRTPKPYNYPEGGPENGKLPFPSISDMNTRVRRIIANYQRNHKKQQLRMQQEEKKMVKRERNEAMNREREIRRVESLQRWSRREEMDFYKLVARFGVEQKVEGGQKIYNWDQFKRLARLEHKSDQTMTDYFYAFYTMCMQVCGKMSHNFPMPSVYVAPITEERAARCLARIDLLSHIREQVLTHPLLEERLQLCKKSSDLPLWWEPGFHDRDLVIAAAKHGVCHTVTHYLNDKMLSFHKQVEMVQSLNSPASSTPKPERSLKLEADSASCSELMESPIKSLAAEVLVKKEAEETKEEEVSQEPSVKQESPDSAPSPAKAEAEEPAAAKVEKMEVEETEAAPTSAAENQEEKKAEAEEPMEVEIPKTEVKEEAEEEAAEAKAKSPSPATPAEKVEEDAAEAKTELVEVKKEEEEASSETVAVKKEEQEEEEKAPEEDTSMSAKVECDDVKVEDRTEEDGGSVEGEEDVELKKELMRQTESPQPDFSRLREKPQPESGEESATPRQKSEYEILREAFPDLYRSQTDMDDYEQSGYGGSEDQLARRLMGDPIGWPKDKVLFNRLEQIAHCVETGEWPLSRKSFAGPSAFNSRSCTPVGSSTPKGEASMLDSDTGDAIMEINQVTRGEGEKDFEVHLQEGEGLKMTFHKRGRPPKRKYEIDVEQAAKLQVYLQQSGLHGSSRDTDSPHRASPLPTPPQPPQLTPQPLPLPGNSGLLNGSTLGGLDPHLLHHQLLMEQRLVPERKRRGRRRKEDEMADMAIHQAIQARNMARVLAHLDPDARVPLVNIEDGSMVKGEEAPRKKDLEAFLQEHNNYVVAQPPLMEEPEMHPAMFSFMPPEMMPTGPVVRRGRRRTRLDPRELEADKMTGEENVSVVNKETGKKITGAKAPPLKHLAQWLEQNPTFDVEAKWSHLVRGSGMFPKEMESRLLKPSNRGRKPNKPVRDREPPMAAPAFSPEMASAMVNMPFAYGFNHLKMPFNHFMPSPLMMGGYGMPMGLNPLALGLEEEQKKAKRRKVDGGKEAEAGVSGLGAGIPHPHPSFPYLHPMLMTPQMLAHTHARMQAGLPPTMSGPFGDLATAAATSSTSTVTPSTSGINGQIDSGSEEEPKGGEEGSRDLQDLAQDLSMKRDKSRRKPSPLPRERERVAHRPSSSDAEPMQTEATDLSMKPKPKPSTATSSPSHKTKKPSVSGAKQNINDIAAGLMMRKKSRSTSVEEETEGVMEQGEDSHQSFSKEPASDSESCADKSCAESIPVKEVEEEEEEEKVIQEENAAEKEEPVVEEKVEEKEEEKVAEDNEMKEEAVAEPEKEAEEEQSTTMASEAAAEGETTERTSPQPPADS